MPYQDERYAQIEKEMSAGEELMKKLKERQNNSNQATDEEEEKLLSQDEVQAGVDANYLEISGLELTFEQTQFFENRISFKFPVEFFELKNDEHGYLVYMNVEDQINCILTYLPGDGNVDLQKIKKGIQDGMKASKIKTIWIEEGAKRINGQPIGYCILHNFIPKEEIFNFMMFTPIRDGHIIINFNGNLSVFKYWELIVGAIMSTIEVSNKEEKA